MTDEYIEKEFPACHDQGYVQTSPADDDYNCIALAVGDIDIRLWLTLSPGYYWPLRVPPKIDLHAFAQAFSTLGFVQCDHGQLETGFEKIALYARPDGTPTHAARQLTDGTWSSKIGRYIDINHKTLAALESSDKGPSDYGTVAMVFKRPSSTADKP